ncbi:MAG: hypothetical protein ACLQPD_35345 [Desulfomonilaceae bacterium]
MPGNRGDQEEKEETNKCPYCAETIKKEAVICRFCRMDLETGEPVRLQGFFVYIRPLNWKALLIGVVLVVGGFLSMSGAGIIFIIVGLLVIAWAVAF